MPAFPDGAKHHHRKDFPTEKSFNSIEPILRCSACPPWLLREISMAFLEAFIVSGQMNVQAADRYGNESRE